MRSIAKFLGIALICTSVSSHAAVKNLQEVDFFQAEMEVDSVHTSDAGNTFQASFSGKETLWFNKRILSSFHLPR